MFGCGFSVLYHIDNFVSNYSDPNLNLVPTLTLTYPDNNVHLTCSTTYLLPPLPLPLAFSGPQIGRVLDDLGALDWALKQAFNIVDGQTSHATGVDTLPATFLEP